jgi:hypothetical protein
MIFFIYKTSIKTKVFFIFFLLFSYFISNQFFFIKTFVQIAGGIFDINLFPDIPINIRIERLGTIIIFTPTFIVVSKLYDFFILNTRGVKNEAILKKELISGVFIVFFIRFLLTK